MSFTTDLTTALQTFRDANLDARLLGASLPVTLDASGEVTTVRTVEARFFRDVPNYSNYSTDGVVDIAELKTATAPSGTNVLIVDPIDVGGNFKGVFVTVNSFDDAQALSRLQNTTDGTTDDQRRWCPAGVSTVIGPLDAEITRADLVAIDSDASPSNGVSLLFG